MAERGPAKALGGPTLELGDDRPTYKLRTPSATRVIMIFAAGGLSQHDLFDEKPLLNKRRGEELPDSVRKGQRITGVTEKQGALPVVGSCFKFKSFGKSGLQLSELFREMGVFADDICVVRSMATGDPEVTTRIQAYEMAAHMQTSVPELTDLSKEPADVLEQYGAEPGKESFANNCLLARRLAERGVRFIQLMESGWDHHNKIPVILLKKKMEEVDKPIAALLGDLKQSGMLEDTLVIFCGEFGRTSYCEGPMSFQSYGRDHLRLVTRYQGRDFRLTDVAGNVVRPLLA